MIVAPLHRFDINRRPEFDDLLVQGSTSISYTLFDGGHRSGAIASARSEVDASTYDMENTRQNLIALVAQTYLNALTAQQTLAARDAGLKALEAERSRIEQLLENGRAARVELLRVQAALARARADKIQEETQLNTMLALLLRLTRLNTATDSLVLEPVTARTESDLNRAALLDEAVRSSPRVKELEARTESARLNFKAQRAGWFPTLDLTGTYRSFGSAAGHFTAEWQAGVSLSYPIFTGGARSGRIAEARARFAATAERLRLARMDAQNAVDRALQQLRDAQARFEALQTAVRHQREVVHIEELALETGAGTQTDFLKSQADLTESEAQMIGAQYQVILATVELARVTGSLNVAQLNRITGDTR